MEDAEIYGRLGYDDFNGHDLASVTGWQRTKCYLWMMGQVDEGHLIKIGLRKGHHRKKRGLYRTTSNHWYPELNEEEG